MARRTSGVSAAKILTSKKEKDRTPKKVGLTMEMWETEEIKDLVKKINDEQSPVPKVSKIDIIRKGIAVIKKETEKGKPFHKIG